MGTFQKNITIRLIEEIKSDPEGIIRRNVNKSIKSTESSYGEMVIGSGNSIQYK